MRPYGSAYLLKVRVLGREKRDNANCIKVSLELFKINRDNLTLKPYKKLKEPAILWFTDDKLRLPVEVRAKIFIGDVRATLEGFKRG